MKLTWKLNKLKKILPGFIWKKKKKKDLPKTWEAIRSIVKVGIKSKRTPCPVNLNGFLLFKPVKIFETFSS